MPFVRITYECSRTHATISEEIEVESLGRCLATATEEAEKLIAHFNEIEKQRYGKKGNFRSLINVQPCKVNYSVRSHKWGKVNLVTKEDKTGLYDLLRCERCGQEYRRYTFADPPASGCYPRRVSRPKAVKKDIPKQSKNTLEGWDKIIRRKD